MPKVSTIQQPETERETLYVTDAPTMVTTLLTFRDQRTDLSLRINGSSEPVIARILDVSPNEFLIEDVRPRDAMALMRRGTTFSAAARVKGLYAFAEDLEVLSREEERGLPFYRVSLPASMLVQQRRKAERFRIPMRVSTRGARVTLYRDNPIVGKILDISAGGLRAEFTAPQEPLRQRERVDSCDITIPNLLTLKSRAVIRHAQKTPLTNKVVCGIELTEMAVTDRRRLEQFIQSLAKISPLR